MGCWGITAFESDAGLDAADFIRHNLPNDGKLELDKIIKAMQKKKELNLIPNATEGWSHTGPMVLAEIIVKFANQDIEGLDYDDDWAAGDKKFKSITSFTATKDSIQWLKNYLSETLEHKLADVKHNSGQAHNEWDRWGGWFEEKNWLGWQNHISTLVARLESFLEAPDSQIELFQCQKDVPDHFMAQSL